MARNGTLQNATRGITPSQRLVITGLIAGQTLTEAAALGNVDRTAVYRWMKSDAEFVGELNNARSEQAAAIQVELSTLATLAVAAVRSILTDNTVSPAVRLRAALAIIENTNSYGQAPTGQCDADSVKRKWLLESI